MRILGLPVPFTGNREKAALAGVYQDRGRWYPLLETFAGAWQRNIKVDHNLVLTYHAVYACMTLIASDIAKLRVKLVQQGADGVWSETTSPSFSPVLRKPNPFQNRIQFWESWILSKLMRGNTYVLKQRDARGVVTGLYVLDPFRVTPLVSDDGSVFYQLMQDNLSGLTDEITVPAREIIHDRTNCLFHPLVGTSPIFAAGVAATQGLRIQNNSAFFFGNQSQPGGMLTAPGKISDETANRLKEYWQKGFTGENAGKIAVVGDGLKFEPMSLTAQDSQLIEQLRWTAEVVCSVFHVPPYKAGIGTMPTYNNIQSLNVEYYSQCLQSLIESAELCLDDGLGIGEGISIGGSVYGTEFDVDNLLRMDSVTQMDVLDKASGVMTVNEKRRKVDLGKVTGGDSVYLQQQNFSLGALAKRDAQADPFSASAPKAPTTAADQAANDNAAAQQNAALVEIYKGLT